MMQKLFQLSGENERVKFKSLAFTGRTFHREKRKDSVWMIPEKDNDGKEPLLVTIDGSRMRFEEFDKPESLRVLNTSSLTSSFEAGVEKYDKRKFKIVFLFKPSGQFTSKKLLNLPKSWVLKSAMILLGRSKK